MTFTGIGHDVTTRKAIDRARTFTFVDRQSFEEDGVVDAVELHAYAGTVTVVTSLHVENVYHGNLHSQSQCIQRTQDVFIVLNSLNVSKAFLQLTITILIL